MYFKSEKIKETTPRCSVVTYASLSIQ